MEISSTLIIVSLGCAALGASAGMLGTLAYYQRTSLIGDAIAHAALPGLVLAFLLIGDRTLPVLLAGATVTALLAAWLIAWLAQTTRTAPESALGAILSVFFGFGILLLSLAQKHPNAAQAGLDTFLFGRAATLLWSDVTFIGISGAVSLSIVFLLWTPTKILLFDREYAHTMGVPTVFLDRLIRMMLVIVIVLGLQAVGAVLMSALLIAPVVAARQWTNRLATMIALAAALGAIGGAAGGVVSSQFARMPTGPTIVLILGGVAVLSLLFGSQRGLAFVAFQRWRNSRRLRNMLVLELLAHLHRTHGANHPGHSTAALATMSGSYIIPTLDDLKRSGLIDNPSGDLWRITEAGLSQAATTVVSAHDQPAKAHYA